MSDESSQTPVAVPKKEEPIKRFLVFVSSSDQTAFIRERLGNLPDLIQRLKYDFVPQMPTVHITKDKEEKVEPKLETYINWRGKKRTRKVYQPPVDKPLYPYQHYFEFVKPLTDDELKFWRIFKLGYLCRDFDPKGAWRK